MNIDSIFHILIYAYGVGVGWILHAEITAWVKRYPDVLYKQKRNEEEVQRTSS